MHGNRATAPKGKTRRGEPVMFMGVPVSGPAIQPAQSPAVQPSGVMPGKNTTARVRCASCRALVMPDALDLAGQCDSCAIQRGLFAVKPWRRRKVGTGYDPKTGRWGGRRGRS